MNLLASLDFSGSEINIQPDKDLQTKYFMFVICLFLSFNLGSSNKQFLTFLLNKKKEYEKFAVSSNHYFSNQEIQEMFKKWLQIFSFF